MQAAAQAIAPPVEPREKDFQTWRAVLARAGHALSRTEAADGPRSYFVSRWGMVRELRSLDEVKRFAEQVGAPAA